MAHRYAIAEYEGNLHRFLYDVNGNFKIGESYIIKVYDGLASKYVERQLVKFQTCETQLLSLGTVLTTNQMLIEMIKIINKE